MPTKKYHHGDLKNALIKAGVEILSKEGVSGLSLRKVAQRAGVSHNAPYSHFPDKQSLIAAISTEGFNQLYVELNDAMTRHADNPRGQLFGSAQVYVEFAIKHTDTFKIMFSGVLEKEKDYPAFVEASHRNFQQVVDVVRECQEAGILRPAKPELVAVAIWGLVHGIVSLSLEGQISHTVLDHTGILDIVFHGLDQMVLI